MNIEHSSARPPAWAEAFLRLLLKPEDRESVSGDLLEEYRDTIVPAWGPAADRWYIWQVGSYLLRTSWGWGAVLGAALVVRYLFDTLVPAADYGMRTATLTYTILGACLLSGFTAAWRTRSILSGVVTSSSAAIIGALLSIAGTGAMLALWHDPATLHEWRNSGGLDEAFVDVPLKLVAIGTVMGSVGALLGKAIANTLPLSERRGA